ncbi:hypothetical protein P4C99_16415 [Pontiellaceae bacterium B1224]|nr:hypothetical protein [Pontiellaceae bacterium B1224]
MKQDYQIWNILHDGALVRLWELAPKNIVIQVEIEYLANKLNGHYNSIFVSLKNCTLFEFEQHWSKDDIRHYSTIQELEGITPGLMVLSCCEKEGHLEIDDISGVIRTKYDSAELTLENGNALTFEELDAAAKEYWDDFGKRKNT